MIDKDLAGHVLTDDERRRILYSALLRQARETQPLRERALEKLILSALFGTSPESPLTVGEIQSVISADPSGPRIRTETVQATLRSLIEQQKVQETKRRKKNAYFVGEAVNAELQVQLQSLATLFSNCVQRMASGTEPVVSSVIAAEIAANFISECFGRYGRHIAESFTGDLGRDELLSRIDVNSALRQAAAAYKLTREAFALIESRCVEFLRSRNHEDERLKFYVTQAYYFAQLLGLEERLLRPLTDELFSGSVFYLDTNIVIRRLLASRDQPSALFEVHSVAKRLGIELRVTRATINEARRVAAARSSELKRVLEKVPDVIASRTRDDFFESYFDAREQSPTLTVDEFFAPFDRIREIFQDENGIVVEETLETDLIVESELETDRAADVIRRTAQDRRRIKKGATLHHDVAHYRLICRERRSKPRTYFLTQDGTLLDAASILKGEDQAFTFSVLAFLQGVSPFVDASEEEPFVDAFSRLLLDSLPPLEDTFDISELRVLADIWDDVQSTPSEKVVEAYHYVRKELSSIGTQREVDPPQVLLGLRRFLSSSASEQQKALREQLDRERHQREKAQRDADESAELALAVKEESTALAAQLDAAKAEVVTMRQQNEIREATERVRLMKVSLFRLAAVWLLSAALWVIAPFLAHGVATEYADLRPYLKLLRSAVVLCGCVVCVLGSAVGMKRTGWSTGVRSVVMAVVLAVVILMLDLLSVPMIGAFATALGLGGGLAMLFVRDDAR